MEEEFYHELLVDRLGAKQGKLRSDFTVIPEVLAVSFSSGPDAMFSGGLNGSGT